MGVCCCGKRSPAAAKSSSQRISDDYGVPHFAGNPFSDPPQTTAWPDHDADTDAAAGLNSAENSSKNAGSCFEGSHPSSPSFDLHISRRHRRGAVCGEALSHYLTDIKWWTKGNEERQDVSEEWRAEREIVRRTLLTHPLFTGCRDDTELMEEMLNAFQRQETKSGELIAVPGEMRAFQVVVKGRAVAEPAREKQSYDDEEDSPSSPLQSFSAQKINAVEATRITKPRMNTTATCAQWGVGEAFGNEGLLYPLSTHDHDASVRAAGANDSDVSTTVTWRLSRVRYQQLLRLHYDDQLRRVLRVLSKCALFQHLTPVQLFELSERAEVISRDASAVVLSTNEIPTDLLVLMSGTVAAEHERANGHGGLARLQAAVVGPGDCVGDAEWLASSDQASSVHTGAAPAAYTYTTQESIEAVRISLRDLTDLLSPEDLAALKLCSRNLREEESRREHISEAVRALVEQSLLARLSQSDDDTDSEDCGGEEADAKEAEHGEGAGQSAATFPNGTLAVQESMEDDVTVKAADVTNFMLGQFFARPTYCRADGRERGLSMAAFTDKRTYPCGTVLFRVDYETRDYGNNNNNNNDVVIASALSESLAHKPAKPDRLYVVLSGAISVVDARDTCPIFTATRGGSVGEEGLLPPLRCSTAAPLHTYTVVTSEDGCVVYELSAKAFRAFLHRPYAAGLRHFCGVFCVLPYAEYFPENYWRFLYHCSTEREVVGGDVVGGRGAPCVCVALLLDGQVNAYRGEGEERRSPPGDEAARDVRSEENSAAVAAFTRGDIIGGKEAVDGSLLAVAYVSERRTRMLCLPANSFGGLFAPAASYLRTLWSQERYKAVLAV